MENTFQMYISDITHTVSLIMTYIWLYMFPEGSKLKGQNCL